jgi:hypothetical protein
MVPMATETRERLSQARRRRRLDHRLRAGEAVTIPELVEAYCELESTPTGKVVTDDSLRVLRAKVAEARAAHLLAGVAEDDPWEEASPQPGVGDAAFNGPTWYVIAIGGDAELVDASPAVTVIRRLRDAVFACLPREDALALRRRGRPNLHVFESAARAAAAFGVFEHE